MSDLPIAVRSAPPAVVSPFSSLTAFENAERMGVVLCKSKLVPKAYQGDENVGNCLIALEISQRIGCSVLMVMQNLHVIQGRPSWSATFLIAAIESSGKFTPLRFEEEDLGEKTVTYDYWTGYGDNRQKKSGSVKIQDRSCVAFATELATGQVLRSAKITVEMAVRENWYTRPDSKWPTMPEQMLRYRAASFFNRAYCPGLTMGLHTREEVEDMGPAIDVATVPTVAISESVVVPARAESKPEPAAPATKPKRAAATAELSPMHRALETRLKDSGITVSELSQAVNEIGVLPEAARTSVSDFAPDQIPVVMSNFDGLKTAIEGARS